MVFYNTNTDPNKVFIAGIGIGDKPVSLPIIPGISGLEQISINPYNKDQTGVQLATSVVTSYTKTSIFDGTAEGHLTLSDYYAFRLNFIPINETTSTDDKFNLKVLVRNYPIVAGDSATWSDITGSVSRSFDLTKDILIPNGLDIFDSADTMKGWQIANQDLIFIKKTLLDIPNLTDQGVMPRCIVIRGGSQLSTMSDDFTSEIDFENIFNKALTPIEFKRPGLKMYIQNTDVSVSKYGNDYLAEYDINTQPEPLASSFNREIVNPMYNAEVTHMSSVNTHIGRSNKSNYNYYMGKVNFDSFGTSTILVMSTNLTNILQRLFFGLQIRVNYTNILLSTMFYHRFGDISGIPSPATIRKAPMIPTKARQYKIDLTTKEYTRDESTNSIYGYKNGVSLQDQLDEEKNKVVTLDESNEIATLEIQENITINKKGIDKKKKK